ncbi:MAG TPA: ATP-binding cassette domain-containing protein [Gammaproteobacteria bacterium]|nr:ATP-binding cassette domain-containing protein [Gammaproteobacteria bacterium]
MSPIGTTAEARAAPAPEPAEAPSGADSTLLPLQVRGLVYERNGRRLLDGVSFDLGAPHIAVIMGPNGAGKTLLLRLCHGLLTPSAGSVSWGGHRPCQCLQRVTMVFQKPLLLRRSVLANVAFGLKVKGLPMARRRSRAWQALEATSLTHLATRPARLLSGGERQRLAIARAWALEPEILLLDEPTANLDPPATLAVEKLVRAIRAAGTKVVMTTHDLTQARRIGEEVLFMNQGRLLEHRPAEEFFDAPRTGQAAAFLQGKLLL